MTIRTLIIGDIHGCHAELLALFDHAAVADDDVVVSVGDLVDRGPEPAEVVRWFRTRPGAVVLMGNHERKHVRAVYSYGQEVTRLQFGDAYAEAVDWMRSLPYYLETPKVRVVHAAMVPGVPLADQDPAVLAGTTSGEAKLKARFPDGWWHEHYRDVTPIAFGHHVTGEHPLLRDDLVYGLDTGACHGLRLTALSIPDFRLYSVPARPDPWAAVARQYQVPVLRTRAWPTMSWRKIDEALTERADDRVDTHTVELATYLAAVAAWAGAIRAMVPALLERVAVVAAAIGEASYATHPAKALLFLHGKGRLGLADVEARCASPAATLALADKLGLPAPGVVLP